MKYMLLPNLEGIVDAIFQFFVNSFGVLGLGMSIVVLFFIMILQAIIAPIASEIVLSSAGGVLYKAFGREGLYAAIIGGILGSLAGAVVAFYIARWIQAQLKKRLVDEYGHDHQATSRWDRFLNKTAKFLEKFIDEESDDFISIIEERGFIIVLIGRMLPFIPFDAVSYGAGFTRIRTKDFMVATVIGTIPRVIFYVLTGALLGDALKNNFNLFIILSVGIAGLILGLYKYAMRYIRNNHMEQEPVDVGVIENQDELIIEDAPIEEIAENNQ